MSSLPIELLDISDPSLYENDNWQEVAARLRAEDPVHYFDSESNGSFWSVTTYELIKYVDTNPDLFSSANGVSIHDPPINEDGESEGIENFIGMDPPNHGKQRAAVSPSVAPSNLANLEPLIRERAIDILDKLPTGREFNWVEEVSIELTARMLATLFDFPYEDRRKLVYWSDITTDIPEVTGSLDYDKESRQKDFQECAETFYQLWAERAAIPPKFDLISMLAHGDSTKDMLQNPRLFLGNILLLLVGGNDTTRNSISGGVIGLNQFPGEYQKLRDNPSLIPNMVAETVRWQTPVLHMRRNATRDLELGRKRIKKGDKVIMWYISGNRDEAIFPDADRLVVDRKNARNHLAFGFGIHRCMGNRLAEMQLRILWEEILKRFSFVELAGTPVRLPNNFIRGIKEVPVILHPL